MEEHGQGDSSEQNQGVARSILLCEDKGSLPSLLSKFHYYYGLTTPHIISDSSFSNGSLHCGSFSTSVLHLGSGNGGRDCSFIAFQDKRTMS